MTPPHYRTLLQSERESVHVLWIALGLGVVTVLSFFGVWRNDFINYDDNTYVFLNPYIARGLRPRMIIWAFTHAYSSNWHPLTWCSHALDCWLYGLNPAGHHVTNLLLHTASVILLFLALLRMTGATWRSALVAALFGIHPLRLQSVAWVAERKDVLSGLFFMMTLWAYARYVEAVRRSKWVVSGPYSAVQEPGVGGQNDMGQAAGQAETKNQKSKIENSVRIHYLLALGFFALGLMSKPMIITLPFVLVLLDFWPLNRLRLVGSLKQQILDVIPLVREKWPFLVLAILSCGATYLAQSNAIRDFQSLPLAARLENAGLSFFSYLRQTAWPSDLAIFYPFPSSSVAIGVAACVCVLGLTFLAASFRGRWPFASVGWLWYVGMLVPVIGIVQVGIQARADRYTYLPSIGLYLMVAWALASLVGAWPQFKFVVVAGIAASLICSGITTQAQVHYWRNTHTVFERAAKVTKDNYFALTLLAKEDVEDGRVTQAATNLEHVLKIAPRYPGAEYLLGTVLQKQGRMEEAILHLEAATGPEVGVPGKARLVLSLLDGGRTAEAEPIIEALIRVKPGDPNGWLMAAALFKEQGRTTEALQLFDSLMAHNPKLMLDTRTMNYEMGELYTLQGRTRQAVPYYAKAIEISPDYTNALNDLAWILATDSDDQVRDGKKAIELSERACKSTGWSQPLFLSTLAAAYAEAGRFEAATKMAERARDLAQTNHLDAVTGKSSQLLELFRQNKPYREKAG